MQSGLLVRMRAHHRKPVAMHTALSIRPQCASRWSFLVASFLLSRIPSIIEDTAGDGCKKSARLARIRCFGQGQRPVRLLENQHIGQAFKDWSVPFWGTARYPRWRAGAREGPLDSGRHGSGDLFGVPLPPRPCEDQLNVWRLLLVLLLRVPSGRQPLAGVLSRVVQVHRHVEARQRIACIRQGIRRGVSKYG